MNSTVRKGRVFVKGTDISVYEFIGLLAIGMSEEEILTIHPQLSVRHIQNCLAFALGKVFL